MVKYGAMLLVGALATQADPVLAQDSTQIRVNASAGATIASNPFLREDSGATAGAVLTIDPSIYVEGERGSASVNGQLRFTQYASQFGSDVAASIGSNAQYAVDERTSLIASSSFRSSRRSFQDAVIAGSGDLILPDAPLVPDTSFIDPTIAGTRTRVSTVDGSLGLSHALSEVSSVAGQFGAGYTFFGDGVGVDFTRVSASGTYSHRISPRTWLTGGVNGSRINYRDRTIGDSVIISPNVGINRELSETLSLTANAGASFVSSDIGFGLTDKRVLFSGSLSLCNRGLNQAMCFSASRGANPTAFGTVTATTSLSANYDVRLSRTDRVSVSGRYSQTNRGDVGLTGIAFPGTKVVGVSGNYSKELRDNLSVYVSPSYSKIFGDAVDRAANYAVMGGVTVRFGPYTQ